jgi:hypothetical protein
MHRRRVLALVATSPLLAGCNGVPSGGTPDNPSETPADPLERTTTSRRTESTTPTTVGDSLLRERDPPADLQTATRPPAAEPPDPTDDTVSPLAYPDRPESYTAGGVEAFVEAYEGAYRRNSLLGDHGRALIAQGSAFDWTHALAVAEDAGVGRCQYRYSESVERADGVVVGDSPTMVVTYYVDDSVVVRAESTGRRERRDVLDPDPWETGFVLEPAE